MVQKRLKFDVKWISPEDNLYGSIQEDGSFSGLAGILARKEADLCIGGLSMNVDREPIMDSSKELHRLQSAFSFKRKEPSGPVFNFSAYLEVFSFEANIAITISVAILIGFFYHVISYRKYGRHKLEDAVAVVLVQMIQRDHQIICRNISDKVAWLSSSFFSFMIFAFFNALLTSMMTSNKPPPLISTFQDLLDQNLQVVMMPDTSILAELQAKPRHTAEGQVYVNKLHGQPEYLINVYDSRTSKGEIDKILSNDWVYFGGRAPFAKDSRFQQVDFPDWGVWHIRWAYPKDSELTRIFDLYLIEFEERGILDNLRQKWVKNDRPKGFKENDATAQNLKLILGMDNVFFVFCILLSGMSGSIIVGLVEYCMRIRT